MHNKLPGLPFYLLPSRSLTPCSRVNHLSSINSPTSIPPLSPGQFSALSNQRSTTAQLYKLINLFAEKRKFLQSFLIFKRIPSLHSDPSPFPSLLKLCASLSYLNAGLCLHGHLIKDGFMMQADVNNALFSFYMHLRNNRAAYKLFEEMSLRKEESFDFILKSFGSRGFFEEVLLVFDQILALGFTPDAESVCLAIMACGDLRRLNKGIWMQYFVTCSGFRDHVLVGNSLISMYVKMGRLSLAQSAFNTMPNRDVVSWNTLITAYAQNGKWDEVFQIFSSMMEPTVVVPNSITFLGLGLACRQAGDLDLAKCIHGQSIRRGIVSDFRLGTAILDMYAKSGGIEFADMVFQEGMFHKSLVSWNSLLCGYAQNGYDVKAVMHFKNMIMESDLKPDSITFANVLPAYSGLGNIEAVTSIHALIVKNGFDIGADVVLGTAMVDAYGKCLDLAAANSLFTYIRVPNTATWNAMIAAHYLNDRANHGMLLFREMVRSDVSPDAVTMLEVLKLCGELSSLKQGSMVHGFSLSKGFCAQHSVGTALLDMYIKCCSVEHAEQIFKLMPVKNIITWNTMLSGYVNLGHYYSGIRLFSRMLLESDCKPDSVTVLSLVPVSAVVLGGHGSIHVFVLKIGLHAETSVMNSLMDAYAKNGKIEAARSLFEDVSNSRDQCSWNVMIAACGMNGQGRVACELLDQMEEIGYKPDTITFTALLSSCGHSGLVEEGCRYFELMVKKYNIKPTMEHWTCIINMLGRAGRLEEAFHLITSQIYHKLDGDKLSDYIPVWGALLDSCKINMNVELGKLVGETLVKLAPGNSGYHILLSNLYASNNQLDDAAKARRVFKYGNLLKEPGLSLVQISH